MYGLCAARKAIKCINVPIFVSLGSVSLSAVYFSTFAASLSSRVNTCFSASSIGLLVPRQINYVDVLG